MAWSKRGILTLCYPVEKGGLIKNNDDYEKLLHEAFYNEMRVAPEEHAVVMMLSANAPYAQRSKVVQIMFETFNTPALLCVSEDVAALYPARDGIVVKSGHSGTVVSMVRNGRSVRESVVTLSMGGEAVSTRLRQMLEAEYGADASSVTFELLEEIKVRFCVCCVWLLILCPGKAVLREPRSVRSLQGSVAQGAVFNYSGSSGWLQVFLGLTCV